MYDVFTVIVAISGAGFCLGLFGVGLTVLAERLDLRDPMATDPDA